jgi:alanine-glyoxylate transaminase / serine-glyoxylate transaminase / serine-pyruvate transaminase
VLNAMHRASPNIYEGEVVAMMDKLMADLRRVAMTRHHATIYIANGHGAWEAANSNLFSRGDKALQVATGTFGWGWANSALRMGVDVEVLDCGKSGAADPALVAQKLRDDKDHQIKVLMVTHVDTASSAKNNVPAMRKALDEARHPALLAVDAVASLGCDELRMDEWGVDLLVGASQKGLMMPPGLGLLWFSEKARERSTNSDLRTPYWDWGPRAEGAEFWHYFGGTAPTHHLFGMREALTMILDEEGLENVWLRHQKLARAVWAALDSWSAGNPDIGLNIATPAARGHSVTAARIAKGGAGRLRTWLEKEAGVTLGIGLGMAMSHEPAYADFFRIGHMGHINAHMVLGVLASIEAGLTALDIPHGKGAVEAAAATLSKTSW